MILQLIILVLIIIMIKTQEKGFFVKSCPKVNKHMMKALAPMLIINVLYIEVILYNLIMNWNMPIWMKD